MNYEDFKVSFSLVEDEDSGSCDVVCIDIHNVRTTYDNRMAHVICDNLNGKAHRFEYIIKQLKFIEECIEKGTCYIEDGGE